MTEFIGYPKTPRLTSAIIVTEKIDGTNAAVVVTEDEIYAQSRKRIITPEDDNFGFARWVHENAEQLRIELGSGRHFGEWWGSGIQRGYGLTKGRKAFSLFNVGRWAGRLPATILEADTQDEEYLVPGLMVVPTLASWPEDSDVSLGEAAWQGLHRLRSEGSQASPGFLKPEGVIVYHVRASQPFKVFLPGEKGD